MFLLAFLIACSNPAENKSSAELVKPEAAPVEAPAAPAAPADPAAAAAPAGPEVNLTGTVGFTGSKVTKSHDGTFGAWSGKAVVANGKLQSVRFEVDINTLTTDSAKLDGHLKSEDFFNAATFPKATFVSQSVTDGAPADSKLEGANATVEGALTMHGVTQTVRFPAIITSDATATSAKTEFVINRKDFGIVYPGKPDDLIRDEVVIKVDVRTAG